MLRRVVFIGVWFVAMCFIALAPLRAFAYGVVPGGGAAWLHGTRTQAPHNIDQPTPQAAFQRLYPTVPFTGCTLQSEGTVSVDGHGVVPGRVYSCSGQNPGYGPITTLIQGAQIGAGGGCPQDATLTGGQCVCNNGFQPSSGQCVPTNCQAEAGGMGNTTLTWQGNTSSTCYRGCRMQCQVRGYQSSTGMSSCPGWAVFTTSESCQGAGNAGADAGTGAGAGTCPAGQCPGTVNGSQVCVPCNSTTNGPSTSASAPGGAASAPPIPNAPPGTTSSEQTTQCGGGQCTTTTTYRDQNGNTTGTRDERQDQPSFCRENPQSPLCRDSTISGTCGAVQCNGDAVQCAIAREQAARNCEFFAPTGPAVDAGVAAGAGHARPSGHPALAADAVALDFASNLDQTNRLAGSCPADIPLTLAGHSLLFRVSQVCAPVQQLGYLVVAVSLLAAAFIVFRG